MQLLCRTLLRSTVAHRGPLHQDTDAAMDIEAFKRAFELEPLLSRLLLSVLPPQCTAGLAAGHAGIWPEGMDWAALFDLWAEMHPAATLTEPLALPALAVPQARLFWSALLSRHPVLQERCVVLSGRDQRAAASEGAGVHMDILALWSICEKAMHRDRAVRLRFVFDVLDIDVSLPSHTPACASVDIAQAIDTKKARAGMAF